MTNDKEIEYQVGQHIVRARSYEEACAKLDQAYYSEENGKIAKRYAVEAILMQLKKWQDESEQAIYFGALAIHPEASDDCTFGDLIEVATKD